MRAAIPDGDIEPDRDRAALTWWRALVRPTVLVEFLFGLSPLVAMVYWGWDLFLVLMLHILALAVSAAFLILRTIALSDQGVDYFNANNQFGSVSLVRLVVTGLTLFAAVVPLVIIIAVLLEVVGGPWRDAVHGLGDMWRVFVVSAGLWMPLAFVTAWEAISFFADVLVPRIPFERRFQAPERPINPDYSKLSRELQAYLFVRAWVVVRMVILVFGVPVGLLLAPWLGALAVVAMLATLKTAVAVLVEMADGVDAKRQAGAVLQRRGSFRRQA